MSVTSCCCFACVPQSNAAVVESWGKFEDVVGPGCLCMTPCKTNIAGLVSLRLHEHICKVESKTKDNVFVDVKVTIQYQILPDYIRNAFYTLNQPTKMIEAFVANSIRSKIPMYDIDTLYSDRDTISSKLKEEVDYQMETYGYDIVNALVTDIDMPANIDRAMDRIQIAERMKTAAVDAAETAKLKAIKNAEAAAEARRYSAVGLAEQRKAIVGGLSSSIESFKHSAAVGMSHEEVMSMLLLNQYFDTMKDIAGTAQDNTIVLQHNGGLTDLYDQMMNTAFKPKSA